MKYDINSLSIIYVYAYYKIAKGVALFRSGKLSDSLEEVSKVSSEIVTDEFIIQAMVVFYKDAKRKMILDNLSIF